jgi:hypothetical protein
VAVENGNVDRPRLRSQREQRRQPDERWTHPWIMAESPAVVDAGGSRRIITPISILRARPCRSPRQVKCLPGLISGMTDCPGSGAHFRCPFRFLRTGRRRDVLRERQRASVACVCALGPACHAAEPRSRLRGSAASTSPRCGDSFRRSPPPAGLNDHPPAADRSGSEGQPDAAPCVRGPSVRVSVDHLLSLAGLPRCDQPCALAAGGNYWRGWTAASPKTAHSTGGAKQGP